MSIITFSKITSFLCIILSFQCNIIHYYFSVLSYKRKNNKSIGVVANFVMVIDSQIKEFLLKKKAEVTNMKAQCMLYYSSFQFHLRLSSNFLLFRFPIGYLNFADFV